MVFLLFYYYVSHIIHSGYYEVMNTICSVNSECTMLTKLLISWRIAPIWWDIELRTIHEFININVKDIRILHYYINISFYNIIIRKNFLYFWWTSLSMSVIFNYIAIRVLYVNVYIIYVLVSELYNNVIYQFINTNITILPTRYVCIVPYIYTLD